MRKTNCISILKRYFNNIKHFPEERYYFTSLIALAFLSFLILCILEQRNLLNVTNTSMAISILATIASILASIIGIIVAISLVSFELQLKAYGHSVFKKFFIDLPFRFFLWTFIVTIIYTIISAISIRTELSSLDLRIFRSLYLFIFCLLILPFSIQEILLLSEPKRKVKEIINELTVELKNLKKTDFTDLSQELEDKISQLQEVFSNSLKYNDKETVKLILSELDKTTEYLMDKQSGIIPDSVDIILGVFNSFIEEAFMQKNGFVVKMILNSLRDLRVCIEKYETKTSKLLNLDLSLRNILWQTTTEGLTSVSETGFSVLEANLEEDLKNHSLFKRKEINESESESIKYHQESYIETNYLSIVNAIIERAIEFERIDIIRRGFLSIQTISLSVIKNTDLDIKIRSEIAEKSFLVTKKLILKCIEKGIYKMISETVFLSFRATCSAFEEESDIYNDPVKYLLITMFEIAEKNVIDPNYWGLGFECILAITDKCMKNIDDPKFTDLLQFTLGEIDNIVEIIIKQENILKYKGPHIYIGGAVLVDQLLHSIIDKMEEENRHNIIIEKKVKSIIEKIELKGQD